ncbi:MAG: NAD-dependent epimerase/dehydratase family protein [Nitrospinae bacterium]|nr:NAD-dependent epimerase/dehydratase family protein [Nitrospinota bacterium]
MNQNFTIDHATVLVTGASGFIGSHVVDALLQGHCKVHCLVRRTSDLRWLDRTKVQLHYGNLEKPFSLKECLGKTDYVFHCAGLTRAKTRQEFFQANATACKTLYEECAEHGKHLKRIIHISSLASVGPALPDQPVDENTPCKPLTYYGKSKLAGEEIARQFSSSLPLVILRPPIVYGPREVNFFAFIDGIARGWNLQIGHKNRVLSLIYITDLVQAMLRAAVCPSSENDVYFITDGHFYHWDNVVETVSKILNVRPRSIRIPDRLLAFIGLLLEFISIYQKKPPLLDRQRIIDIRQSTWTASSEKFFGQFEFQPQYDLQKGLKETVDWHKKQPGR